MSPRQGASGERRTGRSARSGLTLIELIVAFSLLLILSLMALPVAQVKVRREQERRLRQALTEIRQAIDRHKDLADAGELGALEPENHGYPESLQALVDGIEVRAQAQGPAGGGLGLRPSVGIGTNPGSVGGLGRGGAAEDPFGGTSQRRSGGVFARDSERDQRATGGPETIRFLRSIPVDPITGRREWGLLSVSDAPESRSWSGRNVFDVYSLSTGIALDGSRYDEW